MKLIDKHQGFSAVELLITLFIAATFLVAGFQLYSTIIKDSNSTRLEARASNVAYEYLQKYKANAPYPCVPTNPLTNSSVLVEGLSNVKVSVAITCPNTLVTSISKVQVTVNYSESTRPVILASYAVGE